MKENLLSEYLKTALDEGFARILDIPDVEVSQGFNYFRVGQNIAKAQVKFHKLDDKRYGHPSRKTEYDEDNEQHIKTDLQKVVTRFQISATINRQADDTEALLAGDFLSLAASILSSEESISFLKSKDVGIIRITDAKNPFFQDDGDQNESSPFFEVSLSHDEVTRTIVGTIESVNYEIYRI